MENFWDYKVWGPLLIFVALLGSLLVGNILKKSIPFLRNSLIPTSVLGGAILLIIAEIYKHATGDIFFDSEIFSEKGTAMLEIITYHALALGFVAATLKSSDSVLNKKRSIEIFNTGVTTVASYLLQAIVGLGITMAAVCFMKDFFAASGLLLPFGFGQGTGQAMNYGNIYETQYGFEGGKSFGLTIAAVGFLSAAIGGVIHLNILKRHNKLPVHTSKSTVDAERIETENEIPMQESVDKLTVQIALIFVAYLIAFIMMYLLGLALPGMKSTVYGFNFLLGVVSATLLKTLMNLLRRLGIVKKKYTNNFLLTRMSNFFFDIMIVAGVAAIRIEVVGKYWVVLAILGVAGLVVTYVYNRIVAKKLFPEYKEEQFLVMFGMLTGTASTGIILLREIDEDFSTPAADNLVYQNFPAIAFGFPLMLLAAMAPEKPMLVFLIIVGFFIVMNIILFRRAIFRFKK